MKTSHSPGTSSGRRLVSLSMRPGIWAAGLTPASVTSFTTDILRLVGIGVPETGLSHPVGKLCSTTRHCLARTPGNVFGKPLGCATEMTLSGLQQPQAPAGRIQVCDILLTNLLYVVLVQVVQISGKIHV